MIYCYSFEVHICNMSPYLQSITWISDLPSETTTSFKYRMLILSQGYEVKNSWIGHLWLKAVNLYEVCQYPMNNCKYTDNCNNMCRLRIQVDLQASLRLEYRNKKSLQLPKYDSRFLQSIFQSNTVLKTRDGKID